MTSLEERVTEFVRGNPGLTVDDIARGVQARTADVRDVLLGDGFSSTLRLAYPSDRARVYDLAETRQDGPGRPRKPSQCDRILRVLRDGNWHSAAEIHQRCGYSRLNSRISELRRRGHNILPSRRVEGASGPEAYEYRLIVDAFEETARIAREPLPTTALPPSPQTHNDEQMSLEAA